MSILFWLEVLLSMVIPIVLFSIKSIRQSPPGLMIGATIVLVGMILNRFNVSWFGVQHANPLTYMPVFMDKVRYIPSLPEVAISVGIFSAGILAFGLAVKYLPVFESENEAPSEAPTTSGD